MTIALTNVEIINDLKTAQRRASASQRTEARHKKHADSCDCFRCRDNRKWEQRFEALHGHEMRAYYAPKEPRAGVSASGLKEAGNYTYTASGWLKSHR